MARWQRPRLPYRVAHGARGEKLHADPGDAGQGESNIRRWLIENDWLEAIVALPLNLFYNTGIFTYVWLLRNEKPESHKGRVMLIDARQQFEKEPKSFGNKRNRITDMIQFFFIMQLKQYLHAEVFSCSCQFLNFSRL